MGRADVSPLPLVPPHPLPGGYPPHPGPRSGSHYPGSPPGRRRRTRSHRGSCCTRLPGSRDWTSSHLQGRGVGVPRGQDHGRPGSRLGFTTAVARTAPGSAPRPCSPSDTAGGCRGTEGMRDVPCPGSQHKDARGPWSQGTVWATSSAGIPGLTAHARHAAAACM